MFIIVGGGGQVGYYLARELIAQEHEVLVIEKDSKRAEFIATKRAAYANGSALRHLVEHTAAEAELREGGAATVVTRLTLRDGGEIRHEVRLLRRSRAWEIVAYELHPASAA